MMIPRTLLSLFPLLFAWCSDAFSPFANHRRSPARHVATRHGAAPDDDDDQDDQDGTSFRDDFWQHPSSLESTSDNRSPPNKGDLYSTEDLEAIFNLHNDLSEFRKTYQPPVSDKNPVPSSLHDLVQQFVQQQQEQEEESNPSAGSTAIDKSEVSPPIPVHIQQKLKNIRAIASDVDGTLLNAHHALHPKTADALLQVVKVIQDPSTKLEFFFLATGKTRPGALHNLTPELQTILQGFPGVYIQGLYCIHNNQIVFEQTLPSSAVQAAEELASQHHFTLLGYFGDQIFATELSHSHHIDEIHSKYGEPEPILLQTCQGREWHKLIFMKDDNEELQRIYRPMIDELAETYGAATTQAVPLMLELLPAHCNKGVGVRQLCKVLGIDPETELLAMGDGENDKEMLEMAAIGIALGNAVAVTKDVADVVLSETNQEGGAGIALERYILSQKRIWET